MTRYARAKGSKASNEKLPNDATPWHVMKQQLVENLSRKQESPEVAKSVKQLLENVEQSPGSVASWAEFPNNSKNKKGLNGRNSHKPEAFTKNINETGDSMNKNKKHKNKMSNENQMQQNECKEKQETYGESKKRNINETEDFIRNSERKKQKGNRIPGEIGNQQTDSEANTRFNIKRNKWNPPDSRGNENYNRFNKDFTKGKRFENQRGKQKPGKIRDDKVHKRRKPEVGSTKLMINGVEVEIVKFDGFPVKKEDADRLSELKQKMIMKGIPRKEIDAAMKLERRKAEKALARIKKCVCFHCRKAGHNLSDCPELGSEQAGTGICFKCGSTEHAHFDCKVSKPTEFRYATCFICREQGHIAKQCPDNPRGVYPEGGCCKVCGDVTHLKKDCPDLIREKEESAITVDTITNRNLESLNESSRSLEKDQTRPKKVVKF